MIFLLLLIVLPFISSKKTDFDVICKLLEPDGKPDAITLGYFEENKQIIKSPVIYKNGNLIRFSVIKGSEYEFQFDSNIKSYPKWAKTINYFPNGLWCLIGMWKNQDRYHCYNSSVANPNPTAEPMHRWERHYTDHTISFNSDNNFDSVNRLYIYQDFNRITKQYESHYYFFNSTHLWDNISAVPVWVKTLQKGYYLTGAFLDESKSHFVFFNENGVNKFCYNKDEEFGKNISSQCEKSKQKIFLSQCTNKHCYIEILIIVVEIAILVFLNIFNILKFQNRTKSKKSTVMYIEDKDEEETEDKIENKTQIKSKTQIESKIEVGKEQSKKSTVQAIENNNQKMTLNRTDSNKTQYLSGIGLRKEKSQKVMGSELKDKFQSNLMTEQNKDEKETEDKTENKIQIESKTEVGKEKSKNVFGSDLHVVPKKADFRIE